MQPLRTLQLCQDIFKDHPHTEFAIQSVYIATREYGIVTAVRWKPYTKDGLDTFSVGINTTNLDWPSLQYRINGKGLSEPLSLKNAGGRVAVLLPYVRVPGALELLDAAIRAIAHDRSAISYHIPKSPNLTFCQ